jgi:hypothetical protein
MAKQMNISSILVLMTIWLGTCVDAQSVNMKWCYSSTTCSAGCVAWTAEDGRCYPGTNSQPAARIFVNTSRTPPNDATLIGYSTSADCSGSIVSAVLMPLDGNCYAAGTQSFSAAINGASSLRRDQATGVTTIVVLALLLGVSSLWSVLRH